jgi:cytidylate kinase
MLVRVLDEHVNLINRHIKNHGGHWWDLLIRKYSFTYEDYHGYLAKTILSISMHGGVIPGRGANFVLGPDGAFRVRVVGTPENRAERVAERESISIDQATLKVHGIDSERAAFMQKIYHTDIDDPQSYDIVLNTDSFDRNQTVEMILEDLKRSCYKLRANALDPMAAPALV